jgi:hypothetical protein
MQFHSCQTQLPAPMLTTFFILVIGSEFMHFYSQLTNKLLSSSISPLVIQFQPLHSHVFFNLIIGFGFIQSSP